MRVRFTDNLRAPATTRAGTRRETGLSLVEILIAMFVFLVGILGVLSIFPVAMSSAGKAIGEVRSNILAESAISQLTTDCRVPMEKGVAADNGSSPIPEREFLRESKDADWTGYFVTITDPPDRAGQSRLITAIDSVTPEKLLVCPNWDTPPETGDTYIITRLGLPDARADETRSRDGFVRQITASNKFHVGQPIPGSLDPDADKLTWGAVSWHTAPVVSGGTVGASSAEDSLVAQGVTWTASPPQHRGRLVVVTAPSTSPAYGQVRLITDNTSNTLTVYPKWAKDAAGNPAPPENGDTFDILDRLGYFILFTNGRAAGRVLPIMGHTTDAANGDIITLPADVDLRVLGVTEARRATGLAAPNDYIYKVRNATSFLIIGSNSILCTVLPNQHPLLTDTQITNNDFPPAETYFLNSFGYPKTGEPQTGADIFHDDIATPPDTWDKVTSDYSSVCVFSDNGMYSASTASAIHPVCVDVLVFMNFDRTKSLLDNRRTVGHMTGHIERP